MAGSAILSYSLDKGLDEYEEIKRSEDCGSLSSNTRMSNTPSSTSDLAYIGSEPNLVIHSHSDSLNGKKDEPIIVLEKQVHNKAKGERGMIPSSSDEEAVNTGTSNGRTSKSEFTLVTESLARLVDSSNIVDIDSRASVVTEKEDFNPILSDKIEPKEDLVTKAGAFDSVVKSGSEHNKKEPYQIKSSKKQLFTEKSHEGNISMPYSCISDECNQDVLSSSTSRGDDIEVDVGTDALADISYNRQNSLFELDNGSKRVSSGSLSRNEMKCDQRKESEQNRLECVGVEESVLVDNLFANVTSRTEALASHATSFNLMSSRHGST